MRDDEFFRIFLVLGFIILLPFALYYRLKSRASKEKLDRRAEGLFILLTLRPVALARMLGVVAFVLAVTA